MRGRGESELTRRSFADPRNWSTPKKMLVNFILCLWVLSLTYASTAYVASVPAIEEEYHIGSEGTHTNRFLVVSGQSICTDPDSLQLLFSA